MCALSYQAMHPREPGTSLQKWAHTQVAAGTRVACYHDEIKLSLPAIWTPSHHLLFTFFHVDLQTKLEAPKPVRTTFTFLPFDIEFILDHLKSSIILVRDKGLTSNVTYLNENILSLPLCFGFWLHRPFTFQHLWAEI